MYVDYQDLRIAVRELTHKERLDLWNDFMELPADMTDVVFGRWFDHALARRCIKALYRQNGAGLESITEYHDAESDVYIALPVTPEIFDNLPASIASALALALGEANAFTIDRILQKKMTPLNSPNTNETTS